MSHRHVFRSVCDGDCNNFCRCDMHHCMECGAPESDYQRPLPDPRYNYKNVFASILNGKIPCNKVAESDVALAFFDVNPLAKIHVVVIPVNPSRSFDDYVDTDFLDWNPDE